MDLITTTTQTVSQLPNFFSLVSGTFKTYGKKWQAILIISLCYFLSLAAILIAGMIVAIIVAIVSSVTNNSVLAIATGGVAAMIGIALIILFFSWLSAAMIVVLRDRHESLGVIEIFKRARPYAIPSLWVSILSMPVILFGYVFFIIPGIIFSIWFMFSRYAVISDNERGISALIKSREYGRGHFWSIFLLVLLGILSMLFIDSVTQAISRSLGAPIGNFLELIFNFLFSPVTTIYYYLIFEDLKRIKGDSIPAITKGQKNFIVSIGTLGLIVILAIVGTLFYFAPQIKDFYEQTWQNQQAPAKNNIPILPQNVL